MEWAVSWAAYGVYQWRRGVTWAACLAPGLAGDEGVTLAAVRDYEANMFLISSKRIIFIWMLMERKCQ